MDRSRKVSLERLPISSGMLPCSSLLKRLRLTKFGKQEKLNILISFLRWDWAIWISMTLPWTLHVIPCHLQWLNVSLEWSLHHPLSSRAFFSSSSSNDSDAATKPGGITIFGKCMKIQIAHATTSKELETEGAMLMCMIDECSCKWWVYYIHGSC